MKFFKNPLYNLIEDSVLVSFVKTIDTDMTDEGFLLAEILVNKIL